MIYLRSIAEFLGIMRDAGRILIQEVRRAQ